MTIILLAAFGAVAWAQDDMEDDDEAVYMQPRKKGPVILPGKGHIDVEQMLKGIDLKMDISQLSLSELRVLRNGLAARQGYCFMSADLRGIFSQTSWYDSIMYERWEYEDYEEPGHPKPAPIKYTAAEQAFMAKVKAREDQLKAQNFTPATAGWRVNVDNLVNPYQLEEIPEQLKTALGRNGFAIVPNNYKQLFHVYERNDYHNFPSFVTTDLYLQMFHLSFDCLLREIEQRRMRGNMAAFCRDMYLEMNSRTAGSDKKAVQALARRNAIYFAIGYQLLTGETLALTSTDQEEVNAEIERVMAEQPAFSPIIGGDHESKILFGYNLFRPRGHYTRNDSLKHYFRGMMWLQTVPFGTDYDQQLRQAVLTAGVIGSNPHLTKLYSQVSDPITFLMGTPDNITILQVYDEMKKTGLPVEKLLANKSAMANLRRNIEEIAESQTRIRPKFERTSHVKINIMPQRYLPDNEVLQEMVDYVTVPTLRDVPKGLDVLAAMGCRNAERVLFDEIGEDKRWSGYRPMLDKMKQRMNDINWQETIVTQWLSSLKTLQQPNDKYPYFMKTPQWDKKNLNTALASWAEMKHDAILYAKQPMGAECGSGGPPEPIVKGYVEPNIAFWQKAIELTNATEDVLKRFELLTEKAETAVSYLREQAEFLLTASQKELAGKTLTEEEYNQIEYIGATYENFSLDMVRDPEQWLMGWSDVQGADKYVALVADVYTANADNNPMENRSVLYEAVGPVYDIYTVVEIEGYLYLMRGAILTYREFQQALSDPRLTDEEWQEKLKAKPALGTPEWMQEIIVPLTDEPQDNEEAFYSSGC